MKDEFPHASDIVYLNHAAIGPIPQRTYKAINDFAQDSLRYGATHYPDWEKTEQSLREKLAWLINADSSEDIALVKNTSEALSIVAYGIDWKPDDNVVLASCEFPSNRIVWESLQQRFGITVKRVDINVDDRPEAALLSAIDQNTRLLTTSSVHYDSGLTMDLVALGQACKAHNVLFCIDAIQSLGVIPFDLKACQADFVMADGHKWLLSPEGVALFYCSSEYRERLKLNQYGWRMVEQIGLFQNTHWKAASSAKRFECGSLNNLGIHAMHASLTLFEEIGLETVNRNIVNNILYLIDLIRNIEDCELHLPGSRAIQSGIISFSHKRLNNDALYKALMQNGIICSLRGKGIRFSPHFYQGQSEMSYAINTLKRILKTADTV